MGGFWHRAAKGLAFEVIAKPEKLTMDNGQWTMDNCGCGYRRNVIVFAGRPAILSLKSGIGLARFLGGFATGSFNWNKRHD
jgi:hypothetical protein